MGSKERKKGVLFSGVICDVASPLHLPHTHSLAHKACRYTAPVSVLRPAIRSADHHQYAHKYGITCMPPHPREEVGDRVARFTTYVPSSRENGRGGGRTSRGRGDLFSVIHAYTFRWQLLSCALARDLDLSAWARSCNRLRQHVRTGRPAAAQASSCSVGSGCLSSVFCCLFVVSSRSRRHRSMRGPLGTEVPIAPYATCCDTVTLHLRRLIGKVTTRFRPSASRC